MTRSELAQALRERQLKICRALYQDAVLTISDDGLIEAYITCCICGEKELKDPELSELIRSAISADDWISKLDSNKKCFHSSDCLPSNPYRARSKPNFNIN